MDFALCCNNISNMRLSIISNRLPAKVTRPSDGKFVFFTERWRAGSSFNKPSVSLSFRKYFFTMKDILFSFYRTMLIDISLFYISSGAIGSKIASSLQLNSESIWKRIIYWPHYFLY